MAPLGSGYSRQRLGLAVLWLLGALFVGWFYWQSTLNAAVADVPSPDLAHAWQTVWNVAHGHGFRYTDVMTEMNVSRLSAHADYILILLAPLAWLWPSYNLLLFVQVLAVALGAWSLWRITRRLGGGAGLATLLVVAYLGYGPLQFGTTFQFHAVTLAVPLLLWAIEAVVCRRRWWVVAIWFALALLTKEQVGLVAGPLLWWLAWRQGQRRAAWSWLAVGVLWSALQFLVVIPAARPVDNPHLFWQFYYGTLGSTPGEIIPRLLVPTELWHRLATSEHLQNVVALLMPLAFLPLLSPLTLLAAVALLPHWLADYFAVNSLYYQNHLLALPPLFLAAIFGALRVQRWRRWSLLRWPFVAGWALLIVLGSVVFSPNPWSIKYLPIFRQADVRLGAMNRLSRLIPESASVAVAWGLPPVFRNHATVYTLPAGVAQVDYVVCGPSALPALRDYAPSYAADLTAYLDQSPAFALVSRQGGVGLYRRLAHVQPGPLPASFTDPTLHGLQSR